MPLSESTLSRLSESLSDAHEVLGHLELMRIIAYAAHPFHSFILKPYKLLSISQQIPSVNPQISLCVQILDSSETESLAIENRYVPVIIRLIAKRLSRRYLKDPGMSHLRHYYVRNFSNDIGI
jgi:hypothetical protein